MNIFTQIPMALDLFGLKGLSFPFSFKGAHYQAAFAVADYAGTLQISFSDALSLAALFLAHGVGTYPSIRIGALTGTLIIRQAPTLPT